MRPGKLDLDLFTVNDRHEVKPCSDVETWCLEYGDEKRRRVALTDIGPARVSTVFIGVGNAIFETLVTVDGDATKTVSTETWAEAETMHARIVRTYQRPDNQPGHVAVDREPEDGREGFLSDIEPSAEFFVRDSSAPDADFNATKGTDMTEDEKLVLLELWNCEGPADDTVLASRCRKLDATAYRVAAAGLYSRRLISVQQTENTLGDITASTMVLTMRGMEEAAMLSGEGGNK